MSIPYNGSDSDTAVAPSPAPIPGSAPTVGLFQDGVDPLSAVSFIQPPKILANYIDYIQKSARFAPPRTPSALGAGFSAVGHTGTDTGTLAVSGSVGISGGFNYVVQIQLGGAVGVATFKTSIDGGNTFGGLQTTAASMTDATTGITFAFANHFTIGEYYQFFPVFTPLTQWADRVGNLRTRISPNGYELTRTDELREFWRTSTATNVLSSQFSALVLYAQQLPMWTLSRDTSVASHLNFIGPTAAYQGKSLQIDGNSDVAVGNTNIYSPTIINWGTSSHSFLAFEAQWEMQFTGAATNGRIFAGLVDAIPAFTNAGNNLGAALGIGFMADSTGSNWWAYSKGASQVKTDTGIALSTATPILCGLEYFGDTSGVSGGTWGARFWMNGAIVATATGTQTPNVSGEAFWIFQNRNMGAGASNNTAVGTFGPLQAVWNRTAASLPAT